MTNTQPPGAGRAPAGARPEAQRNAAKRPAEFDTARPETAWPEAAQRNAAQLDASQPGGEPGYGSSRPAGRAAPADPPARFGVLGRVLAPLFPPALVPGPGSRGRRAVVVAVSIAAVLAGAAVLLVRQAGTPSWRTIWAEDGSIFVPRALAHPWLSLVRPYAGYEQLVPQAVADLVTRFPLRYTAAGLAVGGALIASASALFVYHACSGQVRLRALRVVLAVSVLLLPTAVIEIANSAVDVQWYLMYALFWALLWRPQTWRGRGAAGVVAFATMASNILNLLYLPLVLARLIALRRGREHAATFGYLAGLAVQIPAALLSHQLSRVGQLGPTVHFYGQHVLVASVLGWRLALRLQAAIGVSACIALAAVVVAALAVAALLGRNRRVQAFAVAALVMGMILTILPVLIRYWVAPRASSDLWVPGSRFTTSAILLIDAIPIVAVDALWRRLHVPAPATGTRPDDPPTPPDDPPTSPAWPARPARPATARPARAGSPASNVGPPGSRRRLTAILATGLLLAGLGLGWTTSFRYLNVRSTQTPWSQHYLHYDRRIHATGQPAGTQGGH